MSLQVKRSVVEGSLRSIPLPFSELPAHLAGYHKCVASALFPVPAWFPFENARGHAHRAKETLGKAMPLDTGGMERPKSAEQKETGTWSVDTRQLQDPLAVSARLPPMPNRRVTRAGWVGKRTRQWEVSSNESKVGFPKGFANGLSRPRNLWSSEP